MLLNLRVANHGSIRQEQRLDLRPAAAADDDRTQGTPWQTIPVAGIFGTNVSAKADLLGALQYMAHMVVSSHRDTKPAGGVPRHHFLLDDSTLDEPSRYVAELLLDGVRHVYGFAVDDGRVVEEWLHSYPHGKKRELFRREGDTVTPGASLPLGRLAFVESITEPHILLLSQAAQSKLRDFVPVYQWFAERLQFRRPQGAHGYGQYTGQPLSGSELPSEVTELPIPHAAGPRNGRLGTEPNVPDDEGGGPHRRSGQRLPQGLLRDLQDEIPPEAVRPWLGHRRRNGIDQADLPNPYNPPNPHAPSSRHNPSNRPGSPAASRPKPEQTPRFEALLRYGGTFVVDEIDASLHTLVTARLIALFQDPRTNPHNAQLIFTTRDAGLLGQRDGEDVDILKRDQVWFIRSNDFDETLLHSLDSLDEFKAIAEAVPQRPYPYGGYGPVPFINMSFIRALTERADRVERAERSAAAAAGENTGTGWLPAPTPTPTLRSGTPEPPEPAMPPVPPTAWPPPHRPSDGR